MTRAVLAFAVAFSLAAPVAAQELSAERLKRITAALQAGVDWGEIPGAVVAITRKGKVEYFEAVGYRDREAKAPMTRDAIFRVASMTKPLVSVAAMMLVEEGKLSLPAPVSRYLPELKGLKVGVDKKDEAGKTQLVLEDAAHERRVHGGGPHSPGHEGEQFPGPGHRH